MIANVYLWAKGYPAKVKAEDAGREFERIEKEYGAVTRDRVLEVAQNKKNPLHNAFEWDDSKAAHKYRLRQAQEMIAHLVIECESVEEEEPGEIRAYLNVSETQKGKGTYLNVKVAMENEDTREIVLRKAMEELLSFKEKYKKLDEFATLIKEIDRLEDTL